MIGIAQVGKGMLKIVGLLILMITLLVGVCVAQAWRHETLSTEAAAPPSGQLIATSAGRMFVTSEGPSTGRPVVLVHGSGAWGGLWAETSHRLAGAGYRAIAIDLPPFGFSDRPASRDYSRTAQAERILAVARAMKLKGPFIVGHSFGGGPATEAVMRAPGLFSKLVLVDPALGIDTPPGEAPLLLRPKLLRTTLVATTVTNPIMTKRLLQTLLFRKNRATPAYVEVLQRPLTRQGSTDAVADWLPSLLTSDPAALSGRSAGYRALALPVAVIWGREDKVTPLFQLDKLRTVVPKASVAILDGVGHIPQIEDPERFQDALLKSLGGSL